MKQHSSAAHLFGNLHERWRLVISLHVALEPQQQHRLVYLAHILHVAAFCSQGARYSGQASTCKSEVPAGKGGILQLLGAARPT